MLKKSILKFIGILICVSFVLICLNVNYYAVFGAPENIHITFDDLTDFNNDRIFGKYVDASITENVLTVGNEKKHQTNLVLKLFGFIPIRQVNAVIEDYKEVYLGGIPLGFSINTKGLIVVGENKVAGSYTNKQSPFNTGDIIIKIDNETIEKPNDITKKLDTVKGELITITVLRKGEEKEFTFIPEFDTENKLYKLGLWVRDDAQGVGTLTFITQNGEFGALGHCITDYETGVEIPVEDGGIYHCNLVGINKAERGHTGELRCLFSQTKKANGQITKNTKFGVFGSVNENQGLIDENLSLPIGNRMLVKLGNAKILSSVSGIREEYNIEIIKANYQPSSSDKSFVFRVADKRLISLTGGIVQGMSGSPIIQNGKIIGAVTHVFLNDATKGYGIYIDWMMEQVC